MQPILFVQGGGADAHEWDEKLAASLRRELGDGYEVAFPQMPGEDDPAPGPWADTIRRQLEQLGEQPILVAHSVGAAIALNAVARSSGLPRLRGLFLISTPFIGKGGWPEDGTAPFDEPVIRLPFALPVYFYHGTANETVPFAHLSLFRLALPHAIYCALPARDHQLGNDLAAVAEDICALVKTDPPGVHEWSPP